MSSWRRRGTDRDISRELCVYLNQKTIRKEDTPPDITHIGLGLGFRELMMKVTVEQYSVR